MSPWSWLCKQWHSYAGTGNYFFSNCCHKIGSLQLSIPCCSVTSTLHRRHLNSINWREANLPLDIWFTFITTPHPHPPHTHTKAPQISQYLQLRNQVPGKTVSFSCVSSEHNDLDLVSFSFLLQSSGEAKGSWVKGSWVCWLHGQSTDLTPCMIKLDISKKKVHF